MLVCNYCGRNLKKEYESCPGCGSNSFKNVSMTEQYEVKNPPKDGYKIKVESYEKSIKIAKILKMIGIILIFFLLLIDLPFVLGGLMVMGEDVMFGTTFIVISLCVSFVFYAIAIGLIVYSHKSKKKATANIERVKNLSKIGILIKNMPYEIRPTGTIVNGNPINCIEVQYESKSGKLIPLRSEPKFLEVLGSQDGTVDLLIDPNDITNYYIDFEIY